MNSSRPRTESPQNRPSPRDGAQGLRIKTLVLFGVMLSATAAASLLMLEALARYAVYRQGWHLKEIDPETYSTYLSADPPYQFPKAFYRVDARVGWMHTPSNEGLFRGFSYPEAEFRIPIKTNSAGFRSGRDFGATPGRRSVAVLGDSFVQALQVIEEDTLVKVIETQLATRGVTASVFNFGISSTGTVHQFRLFFTEVLKTRPAVVILVFFPNDLIDNSPHYSHESNWLVPQYSRGEGGRVIVEEFSGSPSFTTIEYRLPDCGLRGVLPQLEAVLENGVGDFLISAKALAWGLKTHALPVQTWDPQFDVYRKEYPEPLQESLGVTENLLKQMNDYCRSHSIDFSVVLMPAKEQVSSEDWDGYLSQKGLVGREQFDVTTPNRLIRDSLQRAGITSLDLLPVFRASQRPNALYYRKDRHLNAEGHRTAGEHISEFLMGENQLLGGAAIGPDPL